MAESSELTSKKDILDYLRNQQKAAEIEAKVNGINVWVLCGAIAVVIWQLIQDYTPSTWSDLEFPLRLCIASQIIYYLVPGAASSSSERNEIRFLSSLPEQRSPFLPLISIGLLLLPPLSFITYLEVSFSSVFLVALCSTYLVIFIGITIIKFFESGSTDRRFPKPYIAPTPVISKWMGLMIGALFIISLFKEIRAIYQAWPGFDPSLLKNTLLAIVLYWLTYFLVLRERRSSDTDWTYILERELILGIVSTKSALRRIEHKFLGPRLSVVMDDFFDDIDEKLDRLSKAIESFKNEAESIKSIPAEYRTEREARVRKGSLKATAELDRLIADHEEYVSYFKKLSSRPEAIFSPEFGKVLKSVHERHDQYFRRTKNLKDDFNALVNGLVAVSSFEQKQHSSSEISDRA